MSAGNACASIGNANTVKIPAIGAYVQDSAGDPGPSANGPYDGMNGATVYNRNVLGEAVDPAFTCPANSGAATGKVGQWVTTAAAPMTVAADGLCAVALGVVTALATTGTHKCYIAPGTVIAAGSFLWVFLV